MPRRGIGVEISHLLGATPREDPLTINITILSTPGLNASKLKMFKEVISLFF